MAQPLDFGFGDEERMLRDSIRRVLDEASPIERVRRLVAAQEAAGEDGVPPAPYDEALWKKMVELGWTALAVPEHAGGAGMKFVTVAALAEELGRHALPSPLTATLFATAALREAGEAAIPWLERIAAGNSAALAVTDADGSWNPGRTDVRASASGEGVTLEGAASFVQDARKASFFVVSARAGDGVGLYAVPADAPGVRIVPDRILDLTRDQATVHFDGVRVAKDAVIAASDRGADVLERATPALLTLVAADIAGAAEWQLQTTAEYAKVRRQFDRPIGFFQAVKHPIVNMMLAVDETRSLVYNAACAIDSEPDAAERAARLAKANAADTAAFCSNRSVQLHGGIGFTWECDVQIYFKRQKHSQVLFGDGAGHRERIAASL